MEGLSICLIPVYYKVSVYVRLSSKVSSVG